MYVINHGLHSLAKWAVFYDERVITGVNLAFPFFFLLRKFVSKTFGKASTAYRVLRLCSPCVTQLCLDLVLNLT